MKSDPPLPEPWLRGPLAGVHSLVMPVFFSFALVREDLAKHTAGLRPGQIWLVAGANSAGANSVGFQLKHIAGSVDRITSYLMEQSLTAAQMEFLRQESSGSEDLPALLALVENSLSRSEDRLRQVDPASIYDARSVGRRALPTTVIGLLVHLAEHTQRHLGQAITLSKLARQPG
jgi:uncharacterized damage-inducible protein DinB